MKIISLIKQIFRKFDIDEHTLKYILIGMIGITIDYSIFFTLTEILGVNEYLANICSISLAINTNFILNWKLNFKTKSGTFRRFVTFNIVGFIGLAISSALLYLFSTIMSINIQISKIFSILIVVAIQYLINRYFTFKE